MKIYDHEGKKYAREIYSCVSNEKISIDVYSVLQAFSVICPAVQHAVKKLLCAGLRGKGDILDDLKGDQAAIARAIELQQQRQLVGVKDGTVSKT